MSGTAVAALLCGCASAEGEQQFVAGWMLLSLLVVFMLILFVGLLRYLKAGAKGAQRTEQPLDYQYHASDDEEEEGP